MQTPTPTPLPLDDSGFPDSAQLRRAAVGAVQRSRLPMSGIERLVWAVLVLLTLCPAVGFLLAWWMD